MILVRFEEEEEQIEIPNYNYAWWVDWDSNDVAHFRSTFFFFLFNCCIKCFVSLMAARRYTVWYVKAVDYVNSMTKTQRRNDAFALIDKYHISESEDWCGECVRVCVCVLAGQTSRVATLNPFSEQFRSSWRGTGRRFDDASSSFVAVEMFIVSYSQFPLALEWIMKYPAICSSITYSL